MKKWMTYLNERSPLAALSFLSAGIAISTMLGTGQRNWWLALFCVVVNNLIFIQMRLGDELKDYENDKIINPTRPLPRGLLTPAEVLTALKLIFGLLVACGLVVGYFSIPAGIALVLTPVFAWLMFREFYIGQSLAKSPMLYALSHQVIVFPLFGWFGLLLIPGLYRNPFFLCWLLANFGASFTFEICRKLNPDAHKLANTYAHYYGRPKTVGFTSIFMLYSAVGAYGAGFLWYSLPALVILFLSLVYWMKVPQKYKIPAGLSALSSAIILWAPTVQWLVKKWS
jgi:4-hydroxybenzoate polyprenyltransferase